MKICGARTKQRGSPCRMRALGNGGRCKFHGGKSTGAKTPEGRQRISQVQTERWKKFRAENPRLFAAEIGARQERRIKRAFRQRQNLRDEASPCILQNIENFHQVMQERQRKPEPLRPEHSAQVELATRSETKDWMQHLLDEQTARQPLEAKVQEVHYAPTEQWLDREIACAAASGNVFQHKSSGMKDAVGAGRRGRKSAGAKRD